MPRMLSAGPRGLNALFGGLVLAAVLSGCDDDSRAVTAADSPALLPQTVLTLAPHLTELVYAAGAGDRLVGTVEFSDYPAAATRLERVGDAFRLDYEAIARLQPELILAWDGGNPADVIQRLREQGYRVLALDARGLESVSANLRRIGTALGADDTAILAADAYDRRLGELRGQFAGARSLKVFYQVSWKPLFTISDRHVIGEAIALCGGQNVFANLDGLSAAVSLEAVIDTNPDVIIAADFGDRRAEMPTGFSGWAEWGTLPAVRQGNLYLVDADYMARPGLRILEGVSQLCDRLERARAKLDVDATLAAGVSRAVPRVPRAY